MLRLGIAAQRDDPGRRSSVTVQRDGPVLRVHPTLDGPEAHPTQEVVVG